MHNALPLVAKAKVCESVSLDIVLQRHALEARILLFDELLDIFEVLPWGRWYVMIGCLVKPIISTSIYLCTQRMVSQTRRMREIVVVIQRAFAHRTGRTGYGSLTARVQSGRRTPRPALRRPSKACGVVTLQGHGISFIVSKLLSQIHWKWDGGGGKHFAYS